MKASFAFFWCDTVVDKALTAVSRFIRTVPTIIHRVALPPERDALICSTAKLLAPPTNTEDEIWAQCGYLTLTFGSSFLQNHSERGNKVKGHTRLWGA